MREKGAGGDRFRVLFIGDIVGAPGREIAVRVATAFKGAGRADFVIMNAENAAAGRGINPRLAGELFAGGADVLTMGDHVWDQRDAYRYYDQEPRVVRAVNLPPGCPGHGSVLVGTRMGMVAVVQVLGRVFMREGSDCPFRAMDAWLARHEGLAAIFVDVHAEATSEKVAFKHYLDGRVTGVFGTHTHVQTADECVTEKGMGYITDVGMTGAHDSVIGRTTGAILEKFLTGMPTKFEIATGDVCLEGVLLTVDVATKRAIGMERLRER